jgi:hypothetical protein
MLGCVVARLKQRAHSSGHVQHTRFCYIAGYAAVQRSEARIVFFALTSEALNGGRTIPNATKKLSTLGYLRTLSNVGQYGIHGARLIQKTEK